MLDVTPDDIAALADDDLRTLVGLLCETELRKRGLPTSAVTWGGHQDASDGGIDVRVDLPANTVIDGFIPRTATGFQVKKPDMPASAIIGEMRPNGILRPSIQAIADRAGAYVIVSSMASLTDTTLQARRNAMGGAAANAPNAASLALDIYDRTRVATWVRDHPGIALWVRDHARRPIAGWQPYGPWSNRDEDRAAEFVTDDSVRIHAAGQKSHTGMTTVDGIVAIRQALVPPGSAIRLVGLSGVGKTRLVQALFDARIGEGSLDPSLAIYTDTSDEPDPTPVGMVTDLAIEKRQSIIVVDNCPSALHRRLTEVCKGSTVSIITVEYDIREDLPEDTEVFSLEPSSGAMIETVLRGRFPNVSQVDASRIAEFSGGNFRVAFVLAQTVCRGESVSGLTDDQLLERLFRQRNEPNPALMQAAETCSLLYSFDGETVTEDGELTRLGTLVRQDAPQLYSAVAELKRRKLVQARSIWRAVLPPAIANRLACRALQNIPVPTIERQLVMDAPDRVKRSFSRRLGYLHDSEETRQIVGRWLGPGGILSHPGTLDELHVEMFVNVAPVAPAALLATLEREAGGRNRNRLLEKRNLFASLLRSLAYDPDLFEGSVRLLTDFAVEDDNEDRSEAARALMSLFFVRLSGTHATIEERVRTMEELARSSDPRRRSLGLRALGVLLETSYFMSAHHFEFGSRSRNFGHHPTSDQLRDWYAAVLNSAEALARLDSPGSTEVSLVVAGAFRALWASIGMYDDLERLSRTFARNGYWREGWIAIRQTLKFAKTTLSSDAKARLIALENDLRPVDLLQKVRFIVLSSAHGRMDFHDYEEDDEDLVVALQRAEARAEELGAEVANDVETFERLLPEILKGPGRLFSFGRGIGANSEDAERHWSRVRDAIAALPEMKPDMQFLRGFIFGLSESNTVICAGLLDVAVADPVLGPRFPALQSIVGEDKNGVERLKQSLKLGLAPVDEYRALAPSPLLKTVRATDLKELVFEIGSKTGGVEPALELIYWRLYDDNQARESYAPETIEAARNLLPKLEFSQTNHEIDYQLERIVRSSLSGSDGAAVARDLCERHKTALLGLIGHRYVYDRFTWALCETQPLVFLDTFLTGDTKELEHITWLLHSFAHNRRNPLDAIPNDVLVQWCNRDSSTRYSTMAAAVSFLVGKEDEDVSSHWSDSALQLLDLAPDPVVVLQQFVRRFRPDIWGGSLASILEERRKLLVELEKHENIKLSAFAIEQAAVLAVEIAKERRRESAESRWNDRFE